jgi:hypothetical protein
VRQRALLRDIDNADDRSHPLDCSLAVLCIAPASAPAQSVADFYKGKTITIVVSTGTGGGYDALARGFRRDTASNAAHAKDRPMPTTQSDFELRKNRALASDIEQLL